MAVAIWKSHRLAPASSTVAANVWRSTYRVRSGGPDLLAADPCVAMIMKSRFHDLSGFGCWDAQTLTDHGMPAAGSQAGRPLNDQSAGRRAGLVRDFGFEMRPPRTRNPP